MKRGGFFQKKPARGVSGERGTLFSTLVHLWPYIWPSDRPDLKRRVLGAMVLLLFAKLATIAVPFTYKWATDALAGQGSAPVAASPWAWVIAIPIAMTIAYGGMRLLMALLTQTRDGIFARVAMHAVRRLAILTFQHMHQLSLRFHLERKTGGLTRVLERGRTGIEVIVRMVILQLIPTIIEVGLIVAVLLFQFDWRYVLIILATIVLYMGYTYSATEWRINIRRRMNESDTEANTKAVDSLLNYETVKYFVAEERETRRYDRSMARYEDASIKTYTSLAVLNAGQAAIFSLGLAAAMVLCVLGVQSGTHTVGDFVMINAMMIQLYQPLNFMGMVYREIKQAVIDIEMMFGLLSRDPEIKDRPEAKPLAVTHGAIRFEGVSFAYEPERPILKDLSFEVPAGKTIAVVGPSGAGKSTISRLLFRFYDVTGGRILIDGQDIRDVTQTSLRAAIGMVPQDTVLFNDTIRYNIRYGRWEASDEEVEEAARLAQIDAFIRIAPKGYDTEVGERGLKLSGGEKHPPARRGDLGARQPHREGHPGRARSRVEEPHHAGDRAPALDHRRRRRDHRHRRRLDRRARHAPGAAHPRGALCQHVEPPARGRGGARTAGAGRRRIRGAQPQSPGGRRSAAPGCRGGRRGPTGGTGRRRGMIDRCR